jgi:hypothetical protein
MIRIFFTYILPLALPTLIYVIWVWNLRRKHKHDPNNGNMLPELKRGHLFWSIASGILMMIIALITIALITGDPPNSGNYQSPRLEDGKIIKPRYNKN